MDKAKAKGNCAERGLVVLLVFSKWMFGTSVGSNEKIL